MGRCLKCGKDAGILMSYCETCAQVKEPFRLVDRCETCGAVILPDALYCKNCAAPDASNLTIFRKEAQQVKRSMVDRKVETIATTVANAVSPALAQRRSVKVLNLLKAKCSEGLLGSVTDFQAEGDDSFTLETKFSQHGHRTWLKWEKREDSDVIRVEVTHLFGNLDLSKTTDPINFLLEMFEQNIPSFRNSGACLGVKINPPHYFLSLNTTHTFVERMSDKDIADILSIALWDLLMGLMFTFPDPVVMWDET